MESQPNDWIVNVAWQPLSSVTVTETVRPPQIPEMDSSVEPVLQMISNGATTLVITTEAVPSHTSSAQLVSFVLFTVISIVDSGASNGAVTNSYVQPFASVMVRIYQPAQRLSRSSVVAPSFH